MKPSLLLILFAGISFLTSTCKVISDPFQLPENEDAEFYPLEIGKYWVYSADSIIFDKNALKPVDTIPRRWIREEVVDTFLDLTGRTWYRIEQYDRTSDTLPWSIHQVVAATVSGNEALRLENDLTFIKLLFPVTPFKKWDGNKLFDPTTTIQVSGESVEMFKGWEYQVLSTGIPDTVNGKAYSDVATIKNADVDYGIELRYAQEKYARGAGLVERRLHILDTQQIDDSKPWEEKAEKGFILVQKLIETN